MATNRRYRQKRGAAPAGRSLLGWLPYWSNELGARGCSPRTVDNQAKCLRLLAGHVGEEVDARKVDDLALISWRDELAARVKPSTVNRYLLTVGTFYNWLVGEGVLEESPLMYVPLLKVRDDDAPPILSGDTLAKLTKGAASVRRGRSTFEAVRDVAILSMLADTGLRASEVAGLLVEHLNMDARQVYVHPDVAKGGRPRTVSFGFQTARALNKYLLAREGHPFAFLPEMFLARKGAATYTVVHDLVRKAGALEGVDGMRPHLLRHTWAHDMKAGGAELEVLMALGGWTTTSMPMRYGRAERAERAHEAYGRMGSPVDKRATKRKGR